jgi:uncharacterized membrane protein (UPF0127 family)
MKAINLTKNQILAERLECADTVLTRMRGLLGKDSMAAGTGLLIKPCKGVHTICMKFPIDVIFLDKDNVVLAIAEKLLPNRMTRVFLRASSVIELPAGTLENTMTNIADRIKID